MKRLSDLLALLAGAGLGWFLMWLLDEDQPKGWDVLDLKRHVHVIPCDDLIVHDTDSLDCVCGPKVEFHERPLVTHASLDGREAREADA